MAAEVRYPVWLVSLPRLGRQTSPVSARYSLVAVPYLARGVLVALGGRAEELRVLADGGGRGLAAKASISNVMALGNGV